MRATAPEILPSCPKCHSGMRKCLNRDGGAFYGCQRYPVCRGTRDAGGGVPEPDFFNRAPALAAKLAATDWAALPYGTLRRVAAALEGGAS